MPLRIPSGGGAPVLLGRRTRRPPLPERGFAGAWAAPPARWSSKWSNIAIRNAPAGRAGRAARAAIPDSSAFSVQRAERAVRDHSAGGRGARDTVLNLADIFRYFLETAKTFLPLEEELHIVQSVSGSGTAAAGRQTADRDRCEPEALPVPIPILSIQPLVENAVKHGIAPQAGRRVGADRSRLGTRWRLKVGVRDTGRVSRGKATRSGVGLGKRRRGDWSCATGGDAA